MGEEGGEWAVGGGGRQSIQVGGGGGGGAAAAAADGAEPPSCLCATHILCFLSVQECVSRSPNSLRV